MTHTKPMKDSEGDFGAWVISERPCRKCDGQVKYRIWESSCGGFEDAEFRCQTCNHGWWVDGPDA